MTNDLGFLTDENHYLRHADAMPFGAALQNDGSVRFSLFAPDCDSVRLELEGRADKPLRMQKNPRGWFELTTDAARAGWRYRFILPDGTRVPDPASRFQPQDVHGPSEVIDPSAFTWHDEAWRGRPWEQTVLYELHIGTFTREGTFRAATQRLDHLVELGVNAIELMCLSDFAGNRSWGYDTVLYYAPDSAYGTPDELRAFIDAAHARGLSVILDVVYNHFGPEGNWIPLYFHGILSEHHETPWGKSLNFDGEHSDAVREFILHNALYWIDEFHVDGLRLDASHAMEDDSPRHIVDELHDRVQASDRGRPIHLILENEQNIESRLQRSDAGDLLCYAAQWNHDITHLLGAVFSDLCAEDKRDEMGKLAKALAEGFVIAAQEANKEAGCSVPPTAFIAYMQSHDLVGNRVFGERIFADASPEAIFAIVSVYLLLPQIPMLFMGEEWGASTPFPFFCDYHGELAEAVRQGRCDQLSRLDPAPTQDELKRAPDPQAESTLRSAQLQWDELGEAAHAAWFEHYKQLLRVRREAVIPLLGGLSRGCGRSEVIAPGALAITWSLRPGATLQLAANLCKAPRGGFPPPLDRVIWRTGSEPGESDAGQLDAWSVRWSVGEELTPAEANS